MFRKEKKRLEPTVLLEMFLFTKAIILSRKKSIVALKRGGRWDIVDNKNTFSIYSFFL